MHMDDDRNHWLRQVARRADELAGELGPVKVLPRDTLWGARNVIKGEDPEMRQLATQGHRLNMLVADLLLGGGTEADVRQWLLGVRELVTRVEPTAARGVAPSRLKAVVSGPEMQEIDEQCPAFPVGRLAAARGVKVIVLTNVEKFLPPEDLDLDAERRIVMAACGACAYVLKTDDRWLEKLKEEMAVVSK